jgi:hypothetical protein
MPSSVATVKKGLRDFLKVAPGLTTADGVTIRSAPITPEELTALQVTFGDVTAPQAQAGLVRRAESPTMTCWIETTAPGSDETAIDTARDQGAALLALVSGALRADPTAAGTIPAPGFTVIGETGVVEFPIDLDGSAARRAQYRFTVTWTSHIL